jgi:hypothetical protein
MPASSVIARTPPSLVVPFQVGIALGAAQVAARNTRFPLRPGLLPTPEGIDGRQRSIGRTPPHSEGFGQRADRDFATGVIILVADALTGLIFGNLYAIYSHRLFPASGLLHFAGQRATEAAYLSNEVLRVLLTLIASCQFGGRIRNTLALEPPRGENRLTSPASCLRS